MTISDPRFDASRNPTFKRAPAKRRKIAVDGRFAGLLASSTRPQMDPFGRKLFTVEPATGRDLIFDQAYSLEDGNGDSGEQSQHAAAPTTAAGKLFPLPHPADVDVKNIFEWNVQSDSSDGESDRSDDDSEESLKHGVAAKEAEVLMGSSSSLRLALMSCQWELVSSVDLFVLVHSILEGSQPGGRELGRELKRVAVYTSNFGAARLAAEEEKGPQIALPTLAENEEDPLVGFDARRTGILETKAEKVQQMIEAALKRYEEEKTQYYFAVIEVGSLEAADVVYNELEGTETAFAAGGALDVRFIPDDVPPFTDSSPRPPVSVCLKIPPAGYKPPASWTKAAGASLASASRLDWDGSCLKRKKVLQRKFTATELRKMDLEDYVAESLSASEAEETDGGSLAQLLSQVELPEELAATVADKLSCREREVAKKIDSVQELRDKLLGGSFNADLEKLVANNSTFDELQVTLPADTFAFSAPAPRRELKSGKFGAITPHNDGEAPDVDDGFLVAADDDDDAHGIPSADGKQRHPFPLSEAANTLPTSVTPQKMLKSEFEFLSGRQKGDGDAKAVHKKRKGGRKHRAIADRNEDDVEAGAKIDGTSLIKSDERFAEMLRDRRFAIDATLPVMTSKKAAAPQKSSRR